MIRIEDYLTPDQILLGLEAGSKAEGLRLMVDRLAGQGLIKDAGKIHRALLEREKLMTTGVKTGFAFPHAFSEQFEKSFLTIGAFPAGLPFDSLDKQAVQFIFLLLGAPGDPPLHLNLLARISRLTGQPGMLNSLGDAKRGADILQQLVETESRLIAIPYKDSTPEKS